SIQPAAPARRRLSRNNGVAAGSPSIPAASPSRSLAPDGRAISLLPPRRQPRGPAQGGGSHADAAEVGADPRRPAPRLRLRARPAHHAEKHRQQRRDRRDLGEVRFFVLFVKTLVLFVLKIQTRRTRRTHEGHWRSGRFHASVPITGRRPPTRCSRNSGRRGSRGRRKSTPRSPPRPNSKPCTTSPIPTMRASASPARSRSRACGSPASSRRTRKTASRSPASPAGRATTSARSRLFLVTFVRILVCFVLKKNTKNTKEAQRARRRRGRGSSSDPSSAPCRAPTSSPPRARRATPVST